MFIVQIARQLCFGVGEQLLDGQASFLHCLISLLVIEFKDALRGDGVHGFEDLRLQCFFCCEQEFDLFFGKLQFALDFGEPEDGQGTMGQAEHHYRAEDVWRLLTKARRLKSRSLESWCLKSWPITFGPALISWCRRVLSKSQAGAQSACNECLIF